MRSASSLGWWKASTWTLNEALLKFHTSQPKQIFKVHCCDSTCNQEEVGDALLHLKKARRMREDGAEEGWVSNLQKVLPAEGDDELPGLRRRAQEALGGTQKEDAPAQRKKGDQKEKDSETSETKKKKKKGRKKKKKDKSRKKEKGSRGGETVSSDDVKMDGSQPKRACAKKARWLFAGTGLDPKESVRGRVARRARRHMKRRAEKDSSSSSSSGSKASTSDHAEVEEETLFAQASKVRVLADRFPGALCSQAIGQMRTTLLQEVGLDDKPGTLPPVAVAYYRQQLQRRASGPSQRELMTLTSGIDLLLKGKAAAAADLLIQRVKSIEHTMAGSHWTVSQRLEILPGEHQILTASAEASAAQKELYQETKLRNLAANPGERPGQKGGKVSDRGKGDYKGKGGDRERKGGKGQGQKGEAPKKKEGEK